MPHLFIDFETRSQIALTGPSGVGAHVYAEHPSTAILCMAWALDDEPVRVWVPSRGDAGCEWEDHIAESGITLVAHNCEFERAILRHKLRIDTPIRRWSDTSARAARLALPRSLGEACEALGLEVKKDAEGQRVMMKLSKPRRVSRDNAAEFWTPETKPEDFERLYSYCADDVAAMRGLHHAIPELSPTERRIWEQTVESNERGVKVDVASLPRAQALADQVEQRLVGEFYDLVGVNPNSPVKAAAALGLPDFTEDTVRKALAADGLEARTRRALEVRQLQAYSSIKKLGAFRDRTSGDGRLRGSMIYSGAERTQRWSAGGVQIQNLPSAQTAPPPRDMSLAFEVLRADCLDLVHDNVLGALASMLRGFFVGPFLVGDYSQIEARVTAWLAKQFDLLESFATGSDPYKQMASVIYAVDFDKIVKAQREVGKRAILGCGYGMGADKFQRSLDEQYGIRISAELAERTVSAYRRKYARIPKLWRDLGEGFERVVRGQHSKIQAGPVEMGMTEIANKPFAYIRLPSGRAIFYGWPEIDGSGEVRYFGRDNYSPGKKWGMVSTWGGKICENIVQALSRDLLADAVIRMEEAGFPVSFLVHDELVTEGRPEDLEKFRAVFRTAPAWAATLPLGVECFATERYRK